MPNGMVLYQQAMSWVANVTPSTAWGRPAANPHGVVGTAQNPGVGPGAGVFGRPQPRDLEAIGQNLWDRYAQAIYVSESVKDRSGRLTGRLRFDIAPGSAIRIICMEEKFVAQQTVPVDGGNPYYALYATVGMLTHTLDAERMQAETRVEFNHVRNKGEALDPAFSTVNHPLYTFPWPGGPLVFHPAFFRPPEIGRGWDDRFGP